MKCPRCGHDNLQARELCGGCGTALSPFIGLRVEAAQDHSIRYHGLDALRGMAMLLGIILHAALPYMPNVEAFWPADENSSHAINVIFHFIHIWRMPLFFILAGFFANLVITRKSWTHWWRNRLLRIGLPIIVFSPLMSLTLPWIFKYGRTGDLAFFYSNEGQPFHLWFLWHVLIFVILTAMFRFHCLMGARVWGSLDRPGLGFIGSACRKSRPVLSGILFRSRFPFVFIIACLVINLSTGGELILNVGASLLYFFFGYSLYRNPSLFVFLKTQWRYYFLAGIVGFFLFMIVTLTIASNVSGNIYDDDVAGAIEKGKDIEFLWLLQYLLKIVCSVLFSYAFIGLAEKRFGSYSARLRFISDGAYWMYLIHLPVVIFITFFMFDLHVPVMIKFVVSIVATSVICLGTYKYFVRSSFIGLLLNGKRHPFKITGL
jgi:hypothetical protein